MEHGVEVGATVGVAAGAVEVAPLVEVEVGRPAVLVDVGGATVLVLVGEGVTPQPIGT